MSRSGDVATVVAATGASGLMLATLGLDMGSVLLVMALAPLVVAGRVDARSRRLPNRLLAAAVIPAGLAVVAAHGWTPAAALSVFLGVVVFAGPVLTLHLINPSGMGFGDVKLAVVLGLLMSGTDWRLGIAALLVASLGSALWCLVRSQSSIAFGPPLIGALVLVLVAHRFGLPHLLGAPISGVLS